MLLPPAPQSMLNNGPRCGPLQGEEWVVCAQHWLGGWGGSIARVWYEWKVHYFTKKWSQKRVLFWLMFFRMLTMFYFFRVKHFPCTTHCFLGGSQEGNHIGGIPDTGVVWCVLRRFKRKARIFFVQQCRAFHEIVFVVWKINLLKSKLKN